MTWDLPTELANADRHDRYQDRIIARMWVYHHDLTLTGRAYADRKTEYEGLLGKVVITERAAGERSAEVCAHKAMQNDDVYRAKVLYRAAEQRVTADREALRILHAQLDDLRTQAADARKADEFQARMP